MSITHGMILAAGYGKRLRPITNTIPKPLVKVNNAPLIDYAIDNMRSIGIEHIAVNVSYLGNQIEDYLASQPITISKEETPLETGGGIAKALSLLGDAPFLVMNSDTILVDEKSRSLDAIQDLCNELDVDIVLVLQPTEHATGYAGKGDFYVDAQGMIERRGDRESAPYVFTGTQLLLPSIFKDCPQDAFSMNVIYDRYLKDEALRPKIRAVIHDGDWLHVGDAEGLQLANTYYQHH